MSLWICRIPSLNSSRYLHKFPIFPPTSVVSFSTSTPKIPIFDYLVNHHQFSPECAANVSSSSSTKLLNKPQNADSVLNFLKETGFAKTHIEAVVQKVPSVLSANLETSIKPKIKIFQDLGFDSVDFADIISAYPLLLGRSPDRLRLSIVGLNNVLGPYFDICKLLKNSGGRFLVHDLDKTLVPNIEYLKSYGICPRQIATYVCRFPVNFLSKPEKFKGYVKRVEEMGVDRKSKMFLCAVSVVSSMTREKWELKLKLFRELGFSEQDIVFAFRKSPQAFTKSERKVRDVTQLLLSVEDISYIVNNPQLLSYSVEKRFKPRLRVLKALESKNLLRKRPALTSLFQIADAQFINKYVIPYSDEVGDLLVAFKGSEPTNSVSQINNS